MQIKEINTAPLASFLKIDMAGHTWSLNKQF